MFTLAMAFLQKGMMIMEDLKPIKKIMKENHVPQWKVAEVLGLNESVFNRKLRYEPDGEFRQQILDAIQKLK